MLYVWPKATRHGVLWKQEMTWFLQGPAPQPSAADARKVHPPMVVAAVVPPMGRVRAVQ